MPGRQVRRAASPQRCLQRCCKDFARNPLLCRLLRRTLGRPTSGRLTQQSSLGLGTVLDTRWGWEGGCQPQEDLNESNVSAWTDTDGPSEGRAWPAAQSSWERTSYAVGCQHRCGHGSCCGGGGCSLQMSLNPFRRRLVVRSAGTPLRPPHHKLPSHFIAGALQTGPSPNSSLYHDFQHRNPIKRVYVCVGGTGDAQNSCFQGDSDSLASMPNCLGVETGEGPDTQLTPKPLPCPTSQHQG